MADGHEDGSRLKSCRAARSRLACVVSRIIKSRSSRSWSSMFAFSRIRWANVRMVVKWLLSLWATKPAVRPIATNRSSPPAGGDSTGKVPAGLPCEA